jgi:glycosyltransferase involved in cell wall biosynthesis
MPSISVVIPTLNEELRLCTLLQALQLQQGSPAFEILVCDGGSNDATTQIAREFSNVTLLEGPRGVSRQRNFGARHAQGELLVFLDADDAPNPSFLARVWKSYRRLPFAVACPWFLAVEGGFLGKFCYGLFNLGFFLGQSTLRMGSGVCLITPRGKFLACGGFDESLHLGEDIHLIRKLCPRYGLHRHLLIPLGTSARRFERVGAGKLMWFYARITPLLILGLWTKLQKEPYDSSDS